MDDLISRKALLKEFNFWYECLGGTMNQKNWIVQDTISSAIDIINEAPAIDAEPVNLKRTPHVIIHEEFEDYWEECSICGYRDISINDSYCPNCRAKMNNCNK